MGAGNGAVLRGRPILVLIFVSFGSSSCDAPTASTNMGSSCLRSSLLSEIRHSRISGGGVVSGCRSVASVMDCWMKIRGERLAQLSIVNPQNDSLDWPLELGISMTSCSAKDGASSGILTSSGSSFSISGSNRSLTSFSRTSISGSFTLASSMSFLSNSDPAIRLDRFRRMYSSLDWHCFLNR
uniref:(northern house mosquito) hypothetical protein n=2 Tax=Culex pipiens TaxID=7175 RepID=A0A8D8FV02_CULPI